MCVAQESLDKFVRLLTSFTWAHDATAINFDPQSTQVMHSCSALLISYIHIMLCVKCTRGHLWIRLLLILHDVHSIQTLLLAHIHRAWIISVQPFNYHVNYSQYHPVLLLPSQSKRNLSERILYTYLISTGAPKYWMIPEDDWL